MDEYLLDEDKKIISDWANRKNISISFRAAGEATLECLKKGAAAKPHSILEKTVKWDRTKTNGEVIDHYLNYFKNFIKDKNIFLGLVGHWENNKPEGLYLTSKGEEKICKAGGMETKDIGDHKVLLLNESGEKLTQWINNVYANHKEEEEAAAEYDVFSCFYTGDYDIHDMLQAGKKVVTGLDNDLLKDLKNDFINKRRKNFGHYITQEKETEYQRVQHGPQSNYIAQMIDDNLKLVKKGVFDQWHVSYICSEVAKISAPVYMYSSAKKEWKELKTVKDVKDFYKANGLIVSNALIDAEERNKYIRFNIKLIIKNLIEGCTTPDEAYAGIIKTYPDLEKSLAGSGIVLKTTVAEIMDEMAR